MKFLTDIFTGLDGVTHDIGRYSWVTSLGALFAVTVHEAWTGKTVDLQAFGVAVASIVTAHGAALWAKKETEPKA
jgi:hypothetical protein